MQNNIYSKLVKFVVLKLLHDDGLSGVFLIYVTFGTGSTFVARPLEAVCNFKNISQKCMEIIKVDTRC